MNIKERALLIKLSVNMPGNARKDKKTTNEVETKLATRGGKWIKQFFPDEAFSPLIKIEGEARTYHYSVTLPWIDEGWRIIPTERLFEYNEKMRDFRQRFIDAVDNHFMARFQEWVNWARQMHNGGFDPKFYSNPLQIRRKFDFGTDPAPIPSGTDFRIKLTANELSSMQSQLDQRVTDAIEAAHRDLWQRLAAPIQHLVKFIQDADDKERTRWSDSLTGNIRKVLDIIPSLNLKGDKELAKLSEQISSAFAGIDGDTLRDNEDVRQDVEKKAQEILDKMSGYLA